jgi:hypothetical protein
VQTVLQQQPFSGHPVNRIDELLPWNLTAEHPAQHS